MEMSVADRIGLLPFVGWIAGHNLGVTLLILLAVTPGAMMVIAPALESRWLPLHPSRQFVGFFPGDISLDVGVAALLRMAHNLPSEQRWYNGERWHAFVLLVTFGIGCWMTYGEWKSGAYPLSALLSPTKLYHNFGLYCGYGYVSVTTAVAVVFGSAWTTGLLAVAIVGVVGWAGLNGIEAKVLGRDGMRRKARSAHTRWDLRWALAGPNLLYAALRH